MNHQQEQEILAAIRRGDLNAFGQLVEAFQQMAFTLAVRVVKDRDVAEDIVQEAMIKAYHMISRFRGDSRFSTWLYQIVYHKALDHLKKMKRVQMVSPQQHYPGLSEENWAFEEEDGLQRRKLVQWAMNQLNAEEQTLLTLYYYESMPVREIAEVLKCTPNRAKVSLHRSRKKLQSLLEGKMDTVNL